MTNKAIDKEETACWDKSLMGLVIISFLGFAGFYTKRFYTARPAWFCFQSVYQDIAKISLSLEEIKREWEISDFDGISFSVQRKDPNQ